MKATNHIDNFKKDINVAEILNNVKESGEQITFHDLTNAQTVELCNELESAGVDVRRSEYDCTSLCKRVAEMNNLFIPELSQFLSLYSVVIYESCGHIYASMTSRAHLLINNRVYSLWGKNGKFELYYHNGTEPSGFVHKEKAPNRIGKATAKKLAQWVEYLDRKEAAAVEYLNKGTAELNALIERLKRQGVEYQRGKNTIVVKNGPFTLKYEITPGGLNCGRPEFYFYNIYRKHPDKDSDSVALDFMLNNDFTNL